MGLSPVRATRTQSAKTSHPPPPSPPPAVVTPHTTTRAGGLRRRCPSQRLFCTPPPGPLRAQNPRAGSDDRQRHPAVPTHHRTTTPPPQGTRHSARRRARAAYCSHTVVYRPLTSPLPLSACVKSQYRRSSTPVCGVKSCVRTYCRPPPAAHHTRRRPPPTSPLHRALVTVPLREWPSARRSQGAAVGGGVCVPPRRTVGLHGDRTPHCRRTGLIYPETAK
jgi:hypothetical protein